MNDFTSESEQQRYREELSQAMTNSFDKLLMLDMVLDQYADDDRAYLYILYSKGFSLSFSIELLPLFRTYPSFEAFELAHPEISL